MQEWNEQKMPKVLRGYSGGRLPGRSTKEAGREEEEEKDENGDRRIRNEIAQEVVVEDRKAKLDKLKQKLLCATGKTIMIARRK